MTRLHASAAIFAFFLLLSFPIAFAENSVAINSNDGRDVLSGIFYANVKGLPVHFVPVPSGNSEIFAGKVGTGKQVLLIQSAGNPATGLAESSLKARNNRVEIYSSVDPAETNLELGRLSGASRFIIVDSAYSESAISVLPYAAQTKSYVLFADRTNIDKVKDAARGKEVAIYGYVDKDVRSKLAELSPSTIGSGEDKYEDNVALAEKTMNEFPGMNRPILTDGSMIEDSIASGSSPILLTGRLVPQATYNFIKQKVESGKMAGIMLVSNELVYPAYDMRERIKRESAAAGGNATLSVLVKFAQALPGTSSGVLGLDIFRVPAYVPSLKVAEILHNTESKKVMVGVENTGEGPLYYVLELKVKIDGKDYRTFGTSDPALVERGESSNVQYDLDLSGVQEGAVTASALVKYGASKKSLEEFSVSEGNLASISYVDNSNISVESARYDKEKQRLLVTVKNNGGQQAFAFLKLELLDEGSVPTRISAAAIRQIEPSSLLVEEFPLILSDKEISLNNDVKVLVDYGGRRGFLNKHDSFTVPLGQQAGEPQFSGALLGAGAAFAVLLILYGAYKLATGRKKK